MDKPRSKRKFYSLERIGTLLFLALLTFTGCSRDSGKARGITNNKDNISTPAPAYLRFGDEVPLRIISAAPSNTEIITALNCGDRLIAIDRYSKGITGLPLDLPEIDFFYPDAEAIIGLEPDLILVNEINSFGVADNPFKLLGELGIKVFQVPTSVSIEGICNDIIMIAEILGVKEEGEALVKFMDEEIKRIADASKSEPEKKSVYFEISSMPTLVSFGQGAYLNEMIEIAGGRNIFADQRGWFSPSAEEILNRNPDLIFTLRYPGEDQVSEVKNRKAFESLTAVREDQVYAIDADSASRPSQNILLALREMTLAINPEWKTGP